MVRIILCAVLLTSFNTKADKILKFECDKLNTTFSGSEISCIGVDQSSQHLNEAKQLTKISDPLQEWIWLADQIKKTMNANDQKMKSLESTKNSFSLAQKGYPNGGADELHMKKVEQYSYEYEDLFNATHSESMLHDALNSCYGAAGFRCRQSSIDDLKIKYAEAQSKKLAILMSYPLLSNNSIRENIEKEIDLVKDYNKGKGERFPTMNDFMASRKKERRNGFNKIMLEGIAKTKKALNKRQRKWNDLYKNNNNDALGEIKFQLGKREKGLFERTFQSYKGRSSDLQTDNTEMITELLAGINIKEQMSDPYVGKAICNIHNRNQDQIKIDRRNEIMLDGALMVAPFFLGPLGVAARLATMGRFANWGVKGRIMIAGTLEGGLIAKDLSDLSKTADKCNGLKIRLLNEEIESREVLNKDDPHFNSGAANVKQMTGCQKELENQILISVAGSALGPLAFMYGKAGRVAGKLTDKGSTILKRFRRGKDNNAVNKFFKSEGLSAADTKVLRVDFAKFKKESGLKGEELLASYKARYQKKYSVPTCRI